VGSPVERGVGRPEPERAFSRGDVVRKRSGSAWQGRVVGEYSTTLTPEGYAVESEAHHGSVQIYPAAALELVERGKKPCPDEESEVRLPAGLVEADMIGGDS